MKQIAITPDIKNCPHCGCIARVVSDNFDSMMHVECIKNHRLTKECGSYHRAVMKWNNKCDSIIKEITEKEHDIYKPTGNINIRFLDENFKLPNFNIKKGVNVWNGKI